MFDLFECVDYNKDDLSAKLFLKCPSKNSQVNQSGELVLQSLDL